MIAELDTDYVLTRPLAAIPRVLSNTLLEGRPLTTRGRWLNRLVLAQFALVTRLPPLREVRKPVFVIGTGRSGSTILGKILSLHPHTVFLNEPKALWHAVVPTEDLIGSYTRGPARYRLNQGQANREVQQAAHRLYGYCLKLTRGQRVVDKYPEMIFRAQFLHAVFPDLKLLFLVRNGWDTVRSIADWSRRKEEVVAGENHDWWGADRRKWRILVEQVVETEPAFYEIRSQVREFARNEDMAAVEWTASMLEGLRLLQSMPDIACKIHFEALVRRPKPTLRALLSFCELPEDDALLEYGARVLSVPPKRQSPELHPAILDTFLDVMRKLGYSTSHP